MRDDTIYVLKYVGSKRRMAEALSKLIPNSCTTYIEPYCGSTALALNSRKFDKKVLNDWNSHIANFWRVASSPKLAPELLKRLQKTTYSYSLFERAKARRETYGANRSDLVEWAVDTYILNWQSFNARGDCWRYVDPSGYDNHIKEPSGLSRALESLSSENVEVHNEAAIQLFEKGGYLEDKQAFIYLDPPYLEGLRSNSKLYQVDMPDVRDHINLLKAIRQAKAKIILSGYWSGRDDGSDLYDSYLLSCGWHRYLLGQYVKSCEIDDNKSMGAEWIWCNYDLKKEAPRGIEGIKSYCDEKKVLASGSGWRYNSTTKGGNAL